ncbi:MAG: DEAD/DEAH box helicase [Candidatus Njordarchaeia archaeon]
MSSKFENLEISAETLKSLFSIGYKNPSEIQEMALPYALSGEDLIGQAKTGSGKTAVFGITIVEKVEKTRGEIQALVLSPTRELALQVAKEIDRIGRFKEVKTVTIYGGQDIEIQFRKLKQKPSVIVCTPGRLIDHMRRGTISLNNVRIVVIDEADKMLEIGFMDDIEFILSSIPSERQLMLFSATMPREIMDLAKRHLSNPKIIKISKDEMSVDHIKQVAYFLGGNKKFYTLVSLLRRNRGRKILIFTNTKRYGKLLYDKLRNKSFNVGYLSGDLTQSRRERVLGWFRRRGGKILIASDVASRGLDIVDIDIVINYDFPKFDRLYVHRIGRTGRFGREGLAVSFVTPQDLKFFGVIKTRNRIEVKRVSGMP